MRGQEEYHCLRGEEFVGPEYLDIDTGKISTRWWHAKWVPESEYPNPLVASRYTIGYEVEGEGTHVVLVKGQVIKVGSWEDCADYADRSVRGQVEQGV